MNVHNLMEELVYTEVNDLFDTAKTDKASWLTCSCTQCRLDTICYVLNRIQPRYIKSGRGLAYSQLEDSFDKPQIQADINTIALEGMKQVLSSKRPHHIQGTDLPDTPVFNFPTIIGRILDGLTFEPVKDVPVLLLLDSVTADSIDCSWENPYRISQHTPGTFTFWVRPVGSKEDGEKRVFPFEIRVVQKGYEEIHYYFEIGISSESFIRTSYSAEHAFILPDIHLFPAEDALSGMQG
jgi:Late competence development protein ComFB.